MTERRRKLMAQDLTKHQIILGREGAQNRHEPDQSPIKNIEFEIVSFLDLIREAEIAKTKDREVACNLVMIGKLDIVEFYTKRCHLIRN